MLDLEQLLPSMGLGPEALELPTPAGLGLTRDARLAPLHASLGLGAAGAPGSKQAASGDEGSGQAVARAALVDEVDAAAASTRAGADPGASGRPPAAEARSPTAAPSNAKPRGRAGGQGATRRWRDPRVAARMEPPPGSRDLWEAAATRLQAAARGWLARLSTRRERQAHLELLGMMPRVSKAWPGLPS